MSSHVCIMELIKLPRSLRKHFFKGDTPSKRQNFRYENEAFMDYRKLGLLTFHVCPPHKFLSIKNFLILKFLHQNKFTLYCKWGGAQAWASDNTGFKYQPHTAHVALSPWVPIILTLVSWGNNTTIDCGGQPQTWPQWSSPPIFTPLFGFSYTNSEMTYKTKKTQNGMLCIFQD